MNEDKKPSSPGSDPSEAAPDDDNPWDDDDGGGRTLATDGPSFELPSNIPSPITAPPPAEARPQPASSAPAYQPPAFQPAAAQRPVPAPLPGKKSPKATMMGFGPPGPPLPPPGGPSGGPGDPPGMKPAPVGPAAPASSPGGMPSSSRMPVVALPRPPSARLPAAPAAAAAPAARGGPAPSAPAFPAFGFTSPEPGDSPSSLPPAPAKARGAEAADADDFPASQQEDGPTMAVASPALASRPLRDDVQDRSPRGRAAYATPGPGEHGGMVDKSAETVALGDGSPLRLPDLNPEEPEETEEATRALAREEMIRPRDASVVVGEDALGDEATLAVGPGQLDFLDPGIAAAMKETLQSREEEEAHRNAQQQYGHGGSPHGGPPHGGAPHGGAPHGPMGPMGIGGPHFPGAPGAMQQTYAQHQQPQSWSGDAAQPASYRNVPPSQPGMPVSYDAMGGHGHAPHGAQGQMPGAFPQSGQHPAHGYPNAGPHSNPGFGPAPYDPQRGMAPMPGQPPGWQGHQPAPVVAAAPTRFTPQVIMLVAVGAVCLAIFVIGIVLFVTTKF